MLIRYRPKRTAAPTIYHLNRSFSLYATTIIHHTPLLRHYKT
jgi:hypothetical protein